MKIYTEYEISSGVFSEKVVTSDIEGWVPSTRDGYALIEGRYHPHTHKVVDGEVVTERSASPGEDYEWNESSQRWELSAAKQSELSRQQAARSLAWNLETGTSLRAMRELILNGFDQQSEAWSILQQVDSQVSAAMIESGLREPQGQ